ncbi:MAG: hypothetical protein ACR2RD_17140 [Woeseiaceae bacterium]
MRGFIEELRYRNVLRVGAAYLVVGWLIAQVADLAADAFNAPDWVMQMLIIALLLGLPVALFLAWAFELTPDGLMRAEEVPISAEKDPRAGRLLNIVIISTLVVAVLLLGWDKLQGTSTPADSLVPVSDKSIAVLPFDDFSPGGNQAWFADGLTEEILNSLARTTDLEVASRTSSFAFRDTADDVPTIAGALGVAHVLEGSVRRSDERLRVTAQLIRAADDKHLWSETFDGRNQDSITIQEETAFAIANALQTAMDPEELARMVSAGTRSVEAWEAYLRALAQNHQMTDTMAVDRVFSVIEAFEHAVAIDPGFADAQLELAAMWENQLSPTSVYYMASGLPREERQQRYSAAIDAAIRHARSDITRAEAEMRRAAFELRIKDQIAIAERMARLVPERRLGWAWLHYLYASIGDYDKARETGIKTWRYKQEIGTSNSSLIQTMHRVNLDDALAIVDIALSVPRPSANILYQSHRALLAAGEVARAADLIEPYVQSSGDQESILMMRMRQACAEGRVADADRLFLSVEASSNTRWLYLKTLGFDDEARELLRPLDTPENLFALSGYLSYLSFEARDYPLLWKTLSAQGIERPPARPMAYRCER